MKHKVSRVFGLVIMCVCFGWMIGDAKATSLSYCDIFPGPAQTWKGNEKNQITMDYQCTDTGRKYAQILNAYNGELGFSNKILPFPNDVIQQGGDCGNGVGSCSLNGPMAESLKLIWNPLPFASEVSEQFILSKNEQHIFSPASLEKKGIYWSYSSAGHPSVWVDGTLILNEGQYWINHLRIGNTGKIEIKGNVTLHLFNQLDLDGRILLSENDKENNSFTLFAYDNGSNLKATASEIATSQSNIPRIVINSKSASGCRNKNNEACASFEGQIYSHSRVELTNGAEVHGSITSHQLSLNGGAKIIGDSTCRQPELDYSLVMMPERDDTLLCDRQKITFKVKDKTDNQVINEFSGKIRLTIRDNADEYYWYGAENDKTPLASNEINVVNGQTSVWLATSRMGSVSVNAELLDVDTLDPVITTGMYRFFPSQFDIQFLNKKDVISGKPTLIEITTKSCSSVIDSKVVSDYTGKRTLQIATDYLLPDLSTNKGLDSLELALDQENHQWKSDAITLPFKKGKTKALLRYFDAGRTQLTLTDQQCSVTTGCDIVGLNQKALPSHWQLSGKLEVNVRPWTFAICPENSSLSLDGTAYSGESFATAGEDFSLKVQPIRWDPILNKVPTLMGRVMTSELFCDSEWITPNFFLPLSSMKTLPTSASVKTVIRDASSSPIHTRVKLEIPTNIDHASPKGGDRGQLTGLTQLPNRANDAQGKGLLFSALQWSDVGSVWLSAMAEPYLGMTIQASLREVGRFFPHHFQIVNEGLSDKNIQPVNAQQSFVYMGEPFSMRAKVYAMPKKGKGVQDAVRNYHLFPKGDTAQFETVAWHSDFAAQSTSSFLNLRESTARLLPYSLSEGIGWAPNWSQDKNQKSVMSWQRDVCFTRKGDKRQACQSLPDLSQVTQPDGHFPDLLFAVRQRCFDANKTPIQSDSLLNTLFEAEGEEGQFGDIGMMDVRYGRLRLDNAQSRFDQSVVIPARAEYWNRDHKGFVLNDKDDVSKVIAKDNYCKQILWSDSQANGVSQSIFNGNGKLKQGRSDSLSVDPQRHDFYREQVQFWLRLTEKNQHADNKEKVTCVDMQDDPLFYPWLQYNWQGVGDDNPSTVVVFGGMGSHDRVIYRGEKNFHSLLQ